MICTRINVSHINFYGMHNSAVHEPLTNQVLTPSVNNRRTSAHMVYFIDNTYCIYTQVIAYCVLVGKRVDFSTFIEKNLGNFNAPSKRYEMERSLIISGSVLGADLIKLGLYIVPTILS